MISEPPDGSYVLATYRGRDLDDDVETVWRRSDRAEGQERGDWWEVRGPSAFCTHCRTTRELGATGPVLWGVVCGFDDPEPYGVEQIRLWPDDEVGGLLAESVGPLIDWAREALGEKKES